jgi:hypothetical protein
MLAKRFIVFTFGLLAIGLVPLALPGDRDLFVDVPGGQHVIASN